MDISRLELFVNTVKYLKPIQIYYRIYYYLRNKILKNNKILKPLPDYNAIVWTSEFYNFKSYSAKEHCFTFLNISHSFKEKIDWNINQFGKLWTYNLNYFDYLNQKDISKDSGEYLIKDFLKNNINLKEGNEPYPISLRGINWVKFLSKNSIKNAKIDRLLYSHFYLLLNNLEYHLLGNHILENAFSLLFGAYYFQDNKLYNTSKKILECQLKEQILEDGGHFELSPMYHQIILSRIFDCIKLINLNPKVYNDDLLFFLRKIATKMTSWINEITFDNGDIPMVNDSTFDVSPKTSKLLEYAKKLKIEIQPIKLSDSGYRIYKKKKYELFIDVGDVGASYQPGHVHSDTFNFILYKNKVPIIVDTGISTYEKNNIRTQERSTESHNTVQIEKIEQTEIWDVFRVARRAKIIHLEEINGIKSTHNGYKRIGCFHTRNFDLSSNEILIKDFVSNSKNKKLHAYIHFHPDVNFNIKRNNSLIINNGSINISFTGNDVQIKKEDYGFSQGYNNVISSSKIKISFKSILNTKIKF